MEQTDTRDSITPPPQPALCLVVRQGAARRSVVPLHPGEITTVGRAHSNRIVLPDAKCSRRHCEIFSSDGRWFVRDLASRNGVLVDGVRVEGEQELAESQVLTVGNCEIEFTSRPESRSRTRMLDDAGSEPFDIIDRKSGTRYDRPSPLPSGAGRTKPGLDELYRMARSMAEAGDLFTLAERTLEGLFSGTSAGIGAVLVLPDPAESPDCDQLECVASRSPDPETPAEVSRYLSGIVLRDREALLARDVSQHDSLVQRDTLERQSAKSVICAPIRREKRVLGVIHLYGTDPDSPLDSDDLEFVLAVGDQFGVALENVRSLQQLAEGLSLAEEVNLGLRQQLEVETELVGNSARMNELRQTIGRVAPTEATVLIRGESGVGKELVARAVHFNSTRKEQPFVCVNCAALTESLLESELFGHEKGSFTGAAAQKMGKFEQAHRGTLFLDEVGEMSPEIQAKFLRVLEGHSFERVGGSKPIQVDVRVVTATNRDLEQAVREGEFRQDLYFRLQVLEILVEPLRNHPDDIPAIAQHFLQRVAGKSRVRAKGFTPDALEVLREYHWPGNVRELKNVVERSVILSDRELLTAEDIRLLNLGEREAGGRGRRAEVGGQGSGVGGQESGLAGQGSGVRGPGSGTASSREPAFDASLRTPDSWMQVAGTDASLSEIEERFITATLKRHGWNKSAAARQLGIERTTLDRKLKKYRIRRPDEE